MASREERVSRNLRFLVTDEDPFRPPFSERLSTGYVQARNRFITSQLRSLMSKPNGLRGSRNLQLMELRWGHRQAKDWLSQ
jgi:hypothetical protein